MRFSVFQANFKHKKHTAGSDSFCPDLWWLLKEKLDNKVDGEYVRSEYPNKPNCMNTRKTDNIKVKSVLQLSLPTILSIAVQIFRRLACS